MGYRRGHDLRRLTSFALRHRRSRRPTADAASGWSHGGAASRRVAAAAARRRAPPAAARAAHGSRRRAATEQTLDASGPGRGQRQAAAAGAAAAAELRSDFAETAFWQPHLLAGPDGTAAIEFAVPDSVTSWNVWVHAVTADLRGGSRPEGGADRQGADGAPLPAALPARGRPRPACKVVVNNARERPLAGTVAARRRRSRDRREPARRVRARPRARALRLHGRSRAAAPRSPSRSPRPRAVGPVAFKVAAARRRPERRRAAPAAGPARRACTWRSRASRPSATRTGGSCASPTWRRTTIPRGSTSSWSSPSTRQLFYSVLEALPYLVDYPYECTEQTLNRFLSTGIVRGVRREPRRRRLGKELAKRETRLETWAPRRPQPQDGAGGDALAGTAAAASAGAATCPCQGARSEGGARRSATRRWPSCGRRRPPTAASPGGRAGRPRPT